MLKIRQEQWAVFAKADREQFECRVEAHVREEFPDEVAVLPPETLPVLVRKTVQRALDFGIDAEVDVVAFVEITLKLGEEFEKQIEYAWAAGVLQDSRKTGRRKIKALRARG